MPTFIRKLTNSLFTMNAAKIPTLLKLTTKTFFAVYVMFLSFFSFSQNSKIDTNQINYQTGFSFEMHNTRNYGLSFGGVIGQNIGNRHTPNFIAGVYCDVVFVDQPIVAPRLKITINHLVFFGFNCSFANYYRNGLNDFRITPEINFSLYGKASVFIGYNIAASKYSFAEIGEYKVGVNINLTR